MGYEENSKGGKQKIDNRNHGDKNKHAIRADVNLEVKDKTHLLLLLYQGEKGLPLTKSRNFKSLLPSTIKAHIGLQVKSSAHVFKLGTKQSLNTNMISST